MRDETLLKLSLVTSIIGLILLFYLAQTQAQVIAISSISQDDIGRTVLLKGNITSVFTSDKGTVFLKISDKTGELNAVIFKNLVSKLSAYGLQKGQQVQVEGKMNEYEGEFEIIPDKITIIE